MTSIPIAPRFAHRLPPKIEIWIVLTKHHRTRGIGFSEDRAWDNASHFEKEWKDRWFVLRDYIAHCRRRGFRCVKVKVDRLMSTESTEPNP